MTIAEENKVRDAIAKSIPRGFPWSSAEQIANAILQSPDLRVTLVVHPTPIAEMIEGLRRHALLSPSESVILDILERMNSREPDV